jgi:hypothetical protein
VCANFGFAALVNARARIRSSRVRSLPDIRAYLDSSARTEVRIRIAATIFRSTRRTEEMVMHFRITGLPAEHFAHLFDLSDEELSVRGAVRQIADARTPGYPCRISLTDSHAGDELLLVNYEHHPVASPYRMRFAIYVRRGEETFDAVDEVPEQLRRRTLAVRAFDADAMMVGWELVDGRQLIAGIERLLADPNAAYLHVHFAAPGCYAARVRRA